MILFYLIQLIIVNQLQNNILKWPKDDFLSHTNFKTSIYLDDLDCGKFLTYWKWWMIGRKVKVVTQIVVNISKMTFYFRSLNSFDNFLQWVNAKTQCLSWEFDITRFLNLSISNYWLHQCIRLVHQKLLNRDQFGRFV